VDSSEIQQAYQAFAGALRAGRFTVPDTGWDAPLIAAHVTANNHLIASVAKQIAAGQHPSYDNAGVTDDERLREVASAAGTLDNLAVLVLQSAARLARAWEQLGPELGKTEVPAKIADSGRVIHDDTIPIREFIERNATSHLQLHLAQLQALQPGTPAPTPEADPPS
jgi:hypothetical protein